MPVTGIQGNGTPPANQIAQFRSDGITAATGLRLAFFSDGFSRAFGMPPVRLINMITEATPLREERPYAAYVGLREIHYSRPGLTTGLNLGEGPIRAVFQAPPAFGGGLIVVSGTTAYNGTTGAAIGTIPGTGLVRWAVSRSQMVMVAAGVAYLYDATTGGAFTPMTLSALGPVLDVAYLAGRFIYAQVGSDQFYWSDIDDASSVDGLSFATAEDSPDVITALAILNDQLYILGPLSVEVWAVNSDPTAPYQPVEGKGYQRGCAAQGSIAFVDNALFWVGENRVVYRSETAPVRISSSSIEDALRQCADIAGLTAFDVTFEGHEFYVLNVPGVGSYAYDCSRVGTQAGAYGDSYARGEWGEWQSFEHPTFRGQCSVNLGGVAYVGDDTTNDLWVQQVGVYTDGGGPLVRGGSIFIKVEEGNPRCLNLVLHGVMGVGDEDAPAPIAEMRWSDDGGRTFKAWRAGKLGAQGAYYNRAYWQRLGLLRAPGRLVEIRVSDPVNAVFSHLELNASRPGY